MNIPKWLVAVWVIVILVGTVFAVTPWTPWEVVFTFWPAAIVTAAWLLWKRPEARFYVVLWAITLVVSDLLDHLGPAQAANVSALGRFKGLLALAVGLVFMLAVWTARKFHKPTTHNA